MTDQELVHTFNGDTGHGGWVSQRAIFLNNLFKEFEARNISLDCIKVELEGHTTFSLKYPVFLNVRDGKKELVQITQDWFETKQNVQLN